ncbi:MAG: apiosidase-like domain-containing protein, partial [Planctomycetota bacterium]
WSVSRLVETEIIRKEANMERSVKLFLREAINHYWRSLLLVGSVFLCLPKAGLADTVHVWEKVEITLHAEKAYENPYTDVKVWVDLKGPGFEERCYGFWDGGDTFRIRVLGTAPGTWNWRSGSQLADPGLSGVCGNFTTTAWTETEINKNPCLRGMIRPTANGHAFEYADGTPFFLIGDTWWATPTFRYRWYDDDQQRPLGPEAGFKDYVRFRLKQDYNCIAMIAAFPNWANDDKPASWNMPDDTVLRSAWRQAGTNSAKSMTNEFGQRAFLFPGKVPGYENYIPNLERINPEYFRTLDKKIDYLNRNGIIPFIEVARRDIGQVWKKFYPWPESYTRYIQYVWSRYQANICFFSPIHFDTPAKSITAEDWNLAANKVIEEYGPPPFGTLVGNNANPSSLRNWGHVDKAKWLGFHQIGNRRTHDSYAFMTEIFEAKPPVPGINGEPYYDGMENAEPGSELAALYCRSAMYGSVLSGGLGGHIYGAGGWEGGMWSGEVEAASKYPIWKVIRWPSANEMRHLKTFILSEGRRYQNLIPAVDLVSPNKSSGPKTNVGWVYCARTAKRDFFLLYFEKDCRHAIVSGALPKASYQACWFNPRIGDWLNAGSGILTADSTGKINLPRFPSDNVTSVEDWGLKLILMGE